MKGQSPTLLSYRINALFRYLICNTLVPTSIPTKIHEIQNLKAPRNIVLSKLDNAFVDNTVYPPYSAQTPTSIPMKRPPQRGERERRLRRTRASALITVYTMKAG